MVNATVPSPLQKKKRMRTL